MTEVHPHLSRHLPRSSNLIKLTLGEEAVPSAKASAADEPCRTEEDRGGAAGPVGEGESLILTKMNAFFHDNTNLGATAYCLEI